MNRNTPSLLHRVAWATSIILVGWLGSACGPEPLGPPATTCEPGTPTAEDLDGDGLPDAVEAAGWTLTIIDRFGTSTEQPAASDKALPDTDGDGLCDGEERALGSNPSSSDSDGDGLDDATEVRQWGSAPYQVDSDLDGLSDWEEVVLDGTSPVLADTDGDGRSDGDELDQSANPLLADLPQPALDFEGAMDVSLDMVLTTGETRSNDVSTSLEQGQSTSFSRSNAVVNAVSVTNSQSITAKAEANYPWGASVSVEGSISKTTSSMNERTSSWSRDSTRSSHRAYAEALSKTRSSGQTISGGTLAAQLVIRNEGTRPFQISDVVVTALRRDPSNPADYRSVATLAMPESANELTLAEGESVGPFRVEAPLAANVALDLLANPGGTFFQVASRKLTDATGVPFAFADASEERTASLVIDYGDQRPVESYRVATNARCRPDGACAGIRLQTVLEEILGMVRGQDYETGNRGGTSILTSLRGVSLAPESGDGPARFWAVMAEPNGDPSLPAVQDRLLDPNLNVEDLVLHARDRVYLAYVQDADRDGLYSREEFLHGSYDDPSQIPADAPIGVTAQDSDGDGLSDFEEVRQGWRVQASVAPYDLSAQVYSDPMAMDTDEDGWSDGRERLEGTDPKAPDTDGDGMLDPVDPEPRSTTRTDAPRLLSLSPSAYAIAEVDAPIVARFDQPVLESSELYVHGSLSGAVFGRVELSSDRRSLSFIPEQPFFHGEQVEVTVSDGVLGRQGAVFQDQVVRRFRTAVAASAGTLTPTSEIPSREYEEEVDDMFPADFDGDGRLDLLLYGPYGMRVYLGSDQGLVELSDLGSQWGGTGFMAGDMDRDGHLDLVAMESRWMTSDPRLVIRFGDGSGHFGVTERYLVAPADTYDGDRTALGDLDGNGYLDVVVASSDSSKLVIMFNNGDGRLRAPWTVESGDAAGHGHVQLLDADGDGDLDLAAAGSSEQASWTLIRNDGGDFSHVTHHAVAAGPQAHLGAADDFDGDGRPDLASGFYQEDRYSREPTSGISLSSNLGGGSGFGLPVDLRTPAVISSLAVGDLEGDGDLDLVAGTWSSRMMVFRNEGDATFPREPALDLGASAPRVALMDVDGDGDQDVLARQYGRIAILENR